MVLGLGFKSRPVRFVVFLVGGVFNGFLSLWLRCRPGVHPNSKPAKRAAVVSVGCWSWVQLPDRSFGVLVFVWFCVFLFLFWSWVQIPPSALRGV